MILSTFICRVSSAKKREENTSHNSESLAEEKTLNIQHDVKYILVGDTTLDANSRFFSSVNKKGIFVCTFERIFLC